MSAACTSAPLGGEEAPQTRVALFVTCLVDLMRPVVAAAAIKLLRESGCEVVVPRQSCCGQPAYNAGAQKQARAIAKATVKALHRYDQVVVPSASCAGMIVKHYPELFEGDPKWSEQARRLAAKTFELFDFLVNERGFTDIRATFPHRVVWHDSCAALREIAKPEAARTLLEKVEGLDLQRLADAKACCGFGGLFSVKYPRISGAMASEKSARIEASDAEVLLSGDLGCLIHMAGYLARRDSPICVRHGAEVLAGMTDRPPIAGAPKITD